MLAGRAAGLIPVRPRHGSPSHGLEDPRVTVRTCPQLPLAIGHHPHERHEEENDRDRDEQVADGQSHGPTRGPPWLLL